jgi:hypothetical protein
VKKMKHRSIHIFILLAAVLVAAPRASQELSDLKDAAGRRIKAEIFNVFLNLQTGDASRRAAPAADSLLASADPRDADESRPAARPRPSTRVEVHARREVPADVAMLGEPVEPEVAELAPEPPAADAIAPAYLFETDGEQLATELAMLGPPENDVTRARPAARREAAAAKRAAARKKRAEDWEREAASVNVRLGDEVNVQGLTEADILSRVEALRQVGVELNLGAPDTWKKVFKVRRAPAPAPVAPPVPSARQACTGRQSAQLACWPAAPEMFFAGE